MLSFTQSVISTKYLPVTVTANGASGPINITGDVVKFAFMPIGPTGATATPGTSDWHTGTWLTTTSGLYVAQILVGPANGGVPLATGNYAMWIQITDNPEVPADQVGTVKIT